MHKSSLDKMRTMFNDWVYRSVIAMMSAIILYETNYVASTISGRIDMIDARDIRQIERLNDIDRRLAVLEDRIIRDAK